MKNHVFLFVIILIFNACSKTQNMTEDQTQNPFFSSFDTPFGVPPFDKIDAKHFMPAFIEAMNHHVKEIEEIAHHTSTPTFENTIVPLEFSGEMLNRVSKTFFSLYYAQTNDTLETIAEQISPLLSEHHDNMYLNEKLFERVKFIHNNKEKDSLTSEQQRLLDIYYKNFVRSGALLNTKQKKRFKNINKEIAELEVNFAKNVLSQTNDFWRHKRQQKGAWKVNL
jgi:peptidyl-dipeptidase Dcp